MVMLLITEKGGKKALMTEFGSAISIVSRHVKNLDFTLKFE